MYALMSGLGEVAGCAGKDYRFCMLSCTLHAFTAAQRDVSCCWHLALHVTAAAKQEQAMHSHPARTSC